MFSKKTFTKIVSLGLIILQCKTSVFIKNPTLSSDNFLQVAENDKFPQFFNHEFSSNPAIANSFNSVKSTIRATAKDNSSATASNDARSAQNAQATATDDSIASAISSGNTILNTEVIAKDKSNAVGGGISIIDGSAIANAKEDSLAVAASKQDSITDNTVKAIDNSTANGSTASGSVAQATANASHGSLADTKVIDTIKTNSDVRAEDKSNATGITENISSIKSRADADNASKAQSVAEATSIANMDLKAVESSKAFGDLEMKSDTDANAKALNGGNAISTSESLNTGDIVGTAEKGSTVTLNNFSNSKSSSNSNSEGTLHPIITTITIPHTDIVENPNVVSIMPDPTMEKMDTPINSGPSLVTYIVEPMPGSQLSGLALPVPGKTDERIASAPAIDIINGRDDMVGMDGSILDCDDHKTTCILTEEPEQEEQIVEDDTPLCVFKTCPGKLRCEMHCLHNKDNGNFVRDNIDLIDIDDKDNCCENPKFLTVESDRCECDKENPNIHNEVPHHVHKPETIPKVDLKAAAHRFIDDNVNGIKHESAQHLNRIQHLLRSSRH